MFPPREPRRRTIAGWPWYDRLAYDVKKPSRWVAEGKPEQCACPERLVVEGILS